MTDVDQAAQWDRWADEDVSTYGVKYPQAAAEFLIGYVKGGRALELGPGVGLVAFVLADLGAEVVGVDLSPQMVARIDANRGDRPVTAIVGDMAAVDVPGDFDLVYATNSTIFSLLTQSDQLRCFVNAARVLRPNGRIVMEAFAPLRQGAVTHRQNLALRALGDDHLDLSATMHDPATQRLVFREARFGNGTLTVLPVDIRYIWPSEMDLMAQLAGLELLERVGGYDRSTYSSDSVRHVSVYGRV